MVHTKKIVINCRFLTQPISGVQRFAIELSKELKKLNSNFVFVTPKNILHDEIFEELNAIVIGKFHGHLWEQIDLKRYVDAEKALLISLGNTGPLFVQKQFITIHDLGFKHHPEWFSYKFRKVYNFLIPRIAKKALHIFTVSKTSKNEIIKMLNVQEDKVTVIHNAVAPVFTLAEAINRKSKNNQKYILTVSSHLPRKNFKRLISAFLKIEDKEIKLIIVGNFSDIFKKEEFEENSRVIFKQNVGDKELIQLYKNASLFVYPSLYEGFGIPIIEAANYGTSLCISNISVFKEICEDQAVYFDPYSKEDIAEKIETCLKHPVIPDSVFFREKYSWNKSALKLISTIQEV